MWLVDRLLPIALVVITPIYAQYGYGDIRLVGGSYQWEGRVEIFISERWGTITDSEWTNNDAQVVCRKLGHFKPGATAHTDAYFGEGSGPIHLDFVQCSGSEYNLTECEIRHDRIRIDHSFDVGVKCQPADEAYREGDIRLVGGSYNWEGRVEIYWTGTWGTISDTSWNNSDAEVVCRQLGHSTNGVVGHCCDYYGEGSGAIHIREVTCSGLERDITNCTYINYTLLTSHAQDVGVECQQGDDVKEGDIRLIPGSYLWQGLVEIFLNGVWGRIHDRGASYVDAKVVCRQLGYNTYNARDSSNYKQFGDINDLFHLTNLRCSGSEYRITECQYDDNIDIIYHSHRDEWIVYCSEDGPETGDILLSYNARGRVDVFLSGSWTPVTDTSMNWTLQNSNVVCRQLGYNGTETYYPNRYTGSLNPMRNLIDDVDCTGTESKLIDCPHNSSLQNSYTSPQVECQYYDCDDGDIRLVNGESEMEGRVEICSGGRWGTVCDSQWTDNHTAVVCRQLGFSDIVGDSSYFTSEMFGRGSGPIFMDYVTCNGSESRLWRSSYWYYWYYWRYEKYCSSFTHYYGCSHSDDVGVRCQPATCLDGQIRLLEGYSDTSGHVRICSNQRWELIPGINWRNDEARVACNALGYSYDHYDYCCFRSGGAPIHQKYFRCRGTEQDLSQCHSTTILQPPQEYIAVVYCNGDCTDGEVRLVGGESEFEGRVEVCLNRRWGTVSSDGWTQTNTEVVCNNLGYDFTNGTVANLSIPPALSKPVYLHNVVCSSSDLNLLSCSFSKYSGQVNDVQFATIVCQQPSCKDGDLKLVGGRSENEGRLEVCFDQRWGTINGDGWTHTDTQVACRQLGYSTSGISYTRTQSSSSLPVHLTAVGCYGSEEKLIDCAHHEYTTSDPSIDPFFFYYYYFSVNYVTTNPSMDISISCFSSVDSNTSKMKNNISRDSTNRAEVNNMSIASLIIAVISVAAVMGLIAIYVLCNIHVIFRKRTKSNQFGTRQSQNTDTIRYTRSGGISMDTKKDDPLLYENSLEVQDP